MSEVEIWNGKNRLQTQVGHHSETAPCIINVPFALLSSAMKRGAMVGMRQRGVRQSSVLLAGCGCQQGHSGYQVN